MSKVIRALRLTQSHQSSKECISEASPYLVQALAKTPQTLPSSHWDFLLSNHELLPIYVKFALSKYYQNF